MSKNKKPEFELQKSVVNYLKLKHKKVLYCASAGGMRTNIRTAVSMKASGYIKGFPDLFLYEPSPCGRYHGLAIELKVRGNYASPEQKKWIADLKERGYFAQVCTGFDEAIGCIEHYINPDKLHYTAPDSDFDCF